MEIVGKIIHVLQPQSGTSAAGNAWKKQEYVLETEDAYPKKICFSFFGDRVDQFPLKINDRVRVSVDIESREYNGRWYTNINGWKSEPADAQAQPMQPAATMQQPVNAVPAPPVPDFTQSTENDDLPF